MLEPLGLIDGLTWMRRRSDIWRGIWCPGAVPREHVWPASCDVHHDEGAGCVVDQGSIFSFLWMIERRCEFTSRRILKVSWRDLRRRRYSLDRKHVVVFEISVLCCGLKSPLILGSGEISTRRLYTELPMKHGERLATLALSRTSQGTACPYTTIEHQSTSFLSS
jgi:hypothetical protein